MRTSPTIRLSLTLEYGLIMLVVVTLIVTLALNDTPTAAPFGGLLAAPRIVAALLCVLFMPGYLVQALFFCNKGDLDVPQRIGLSFALSLSLLPMLVFALDSVDAPIRTETLLISLIGVIVFAAIGSFLRRALTPPDERFMWVLPTVRIGGITRSLDTVLWGGVVVGIIGLMSVVAAVTFIPEPNLYMTEFYILSETGIAAEYPSQITAGDSMRFQYVIVNREPQPMDYDLTVENGDQIIFAQDGIQIETGERYEQVIEVRPVDFREQSLLLLHLYRSGETEPYRTLRYWVQVRPA